MSSLKYTPGEWRAELHGHNTQDPHAPMMWWIRKPIISLGTDNEADAHLIAAAPELYEALCDMLWKRGVKSKDKALAALSKARGEQQKEGDR